MRCPDIDRLIDFQIGQGPDPELEAHLRRCPSCQADLRTIQRIPAAYRPRFEVSEELVSRVMAVLPEPDRLPERHRLPSAQTLITGLLGSLTAMAAVVVAGSPGTGNRFEFLLFSLAVGVVFVIFFQVRAGASPSAKTI